MLLSLNEISNATKQRSLQERKRTIPIFMSRCRRFSIKSCMHSSSNDTYCTETKKFRPHVLRWLAIFTFMWNASQAISSSMEEEEGYATEIQESSMMHLKIKKRDREVIQESRSELDKMDLSHQDLSGGIFAEASLKEADLNGSDLRTSIFSRAILYRSNLSGVDASDAMFDYALLRGVNARGSLFMNANFVRADMGDMDVTDADFTDAIVDKYELKNLCETASGINPYTGVDTRDSLGCDTVKFYEGFNSGGRIQPKYLP